MQETTVYYIHLYFYNYTNYVLCEYHSIVLVSCGYLQYIPTLYGVMLGVYLTVDTLI